MLYFSVHFNCSLRLPDNHCLTCPGIYTKAPPRAEVWEKIKYNLIPLWWAHVKMVPLLFCKLWQNMSCVKGKVKCFALFWKRGLGKRSSREKTWEIETVLYYIARSVSFITCKETCILIFWEPKVILKWRKNWQISLASRSVLTASLFCDRQPRGSILQGLFLLVNTSFPLSRFSTCWCYLLPKKWVNLGVTHPSTRLVLFPGVIPPIFRR